MTQSGGQAAGIQLQVGLDLAFFRNQLVGLQAVTTGTRLSFGVTFKRLDIQNELNALATNIKKRNYFLEVKTNLAAEIKNAGTLAKALRGLDNAVQKNKGIANRAAGGVAGSVVDASKLEKSLKTATKPVLESVYSEMGKLGIRMAKAANEAGKTTNESLRTAILSGIPQVTADLALGLAKGIDPLMKINGRKGAKLFIEAWKDASGIASPSRVFKALGKFKADGLEIGFLNGLKDFKTKAVAEIKSIVKSLQQEARVGMITVGGLLSPVAGPRTAATKTIPGVPSPRNVVSNQDPGRSNNRILNSLSLLTGDPKLYRGRMANLGANRLPSSLLSSAATQMNLESIVPSFKQSRLEGTKTGVANIIDEAFFGRGTLPKASSALNGLSNTIERLASAARAAVPSGILQSASGNPRFRAFGGVPSSQSMGIFPPTAQPTVYPPSGGFLEFSRRATAISAGLPGNVFGGRQPPGGPPGGPPSGPLRPRRGGGSFPSDGMLASPNQRKDTAYEVASQSMKNFRASQLPLIGGLKALGGEFAQATKQVLLYGTAYKGLAFITSLPGQILNAAKSQQQYNNALQTATQDTGTYGKELLYVDNVQRAFGLDLETTRTGFTRLYASMGPTGFDSGSIEKLFTGISAATAALQLTPDKAERVIYAFGQMASKGQIMSEELKGQLGDVLPGALAIFSEAAGMSVKDFSKAMEDGEFVGSRFREVFAKVSDELMNRFGTGAAAAGKSLQGLINVVGGDFKRTLESFAPLANSVAQSILGPLSGALNQLAKAAQIATGETGRLEKQISQAQKDVADLKLVPGVEPKQIEAAEKNILALKVRQEELNEAYKDPAIKSQVENIQKLVSELGKVGNFAMNFASILQGVLGPAFGLLGNNLTTVLNSLISLAVGFAAAKLVALGVMGTLNTMNAVVKAGGTISALAAAKHALLAAAFRILGVQATGAQLATIGFNTAVKGLLASTGLGLLVVALTSAATAFMTLGDKAAEAARKAKQSIDSMTQAAASGNVALIDMEIATARTEISDLDRAQKMIEGLKTRPGGRGGPQVDKESVTPATRAFLEMQGFTVPTTGSFALGALTQQLPTLRSAAQQKLSGGQLKRPLAVQRQEALGLNVPTPGTLPPEDAEELKRTKTRADNLSQYNSLQDQLAKNFTQHQIDLLDIEHQHKVSLMNVFYDLQESRANSHQKAAIRFQKELYNIAAEYQGAQLKAQAEVMKAQGSVAGGALPGGTATGAYLQGNIGPTSTGPHFDVKKMGGGYFPRNYLDQYVQVNGRPLSSGTTVPGGTFAGHQRRGSHGWDYAFGEGRHAATLKGGAQWMGGSPTAHGEARKFQLPTGEQFQFLHGKSEGIGAPGKITADQSRSVKASQQTQLAIQKEKVAVTLKEVEAIRKMEVAMENYVASIVPIAEQDLQNRLLAQRIQLTTDIASPAILDAQIKYAEQEAIATENIRLNNEEITRLSQAKDANGRISVETAARIETLRKANEKLKSDLPTSEIQLLTEAIGKQTLSIIEQVKAKQREAEDSRQVNRLIIEGMTRQEAEAKVTADRLRGDYAEALRMTNEAIEKYSADLEILNLRKAQGIALTAGETAEYDRLTKAIEAAKAAKGKQEGLAPTVESAATGLEQGAKAPKTTEAYLAEGLSEAQENLDKLTNTGYQVVQGANAIGDAFGTAFKNIASGSMTAQQALATMFQSIADHFLDMAAQMIAAWIKMAILNTIVKIFGAAGGAAAGGGAVSGDFVNTNALQGITTAAEGAYWPGGFQAFADGGLVTKPTMGLIGEGGESEYVIPASKMQSAMKRYSGGARGSAVIPANGESSEAGAMPTATGGAIDVRYTVERINTVDYVTADQFQRGMQQAASQGAQQGEKRALRQLQQNTSIRGRVGLR